MGWCPWDETGGLVIGCCLVLPTECGCLNQVPVLVSTKDVAG